MPDERAQTPLLARCCVCRGNIHQGDPYEVWEGGYYCERHSLPYLWARARQYAEMTASEVAPRQEP